MSVVVCCKRLKGYTQATVLVCSTHNLHKLLISGTESGSVQLGCLVLQSCTYGFKLHDHGLPKVYDAHTVNISIGEFVHTTTLLHVHFYTLLSDVMQ